MENAPDQTPVTPALGNPRAEIVFAVVAFGFALFLLTQAGSQVVWSASRSLVNQPGFWPVMAVVGMVIFGAAEITFTTQRFLAAEREPIISELFHWFRALEFASWFLIYVLAVPYLGYLLSTLAFCILLTLRLGYRSRKHLISAVATALAVVLIFKSFLSVKIPGGAIYEHLPAALRNFMIIYF